MVKPRFSPEVNFGHIMQACVLLLTVGGGAVTSYVTLRSDMERLRANLTTQLGGHELRITALEETLAERRADDRDFRVEMRTALARIFDALGDLRTQIVQKQDKK